MPNMLKYNHEQMVENSQSRLFYRRRISLAYSSGPVWNFPPFHFVSAISLSHDFSGFHFCRHRDQVHIPDCRWLFEEWLATQERNTCSFCRFQCWIPLWTFP